MIAFRHADTHVPFLWERDEQPEARWHGRGEGPVAYLAETPDGAWAEFLRHEEITEPEDLEGIARALWAVELDEAPGAEPELPMSRLTGDWSTWEDCQEEARRLRERGVVGLSAPSAALLPETASGFRTDGGLQPGPSRTERVFVLFGSRPDLVAWGACAEGRPRADLLPRVRHLR